MSFQVFVELSIILLTRYYSSTDLDIPRPASSVVAPIIDPTSDLSPSSAPAPKKKGDNIVEATDSLSARWVSHLDINLNTTYFTLNRNL